MKTNSTTSGLNSSLKLFSLTALILPIFFSICMKTVSTSNNENSINTSQKDVLKGGVSIAKDLPQEFYGTWSVISVMLETTSPELFRARSSDIWTFQRDDKYITLLNPVTGAHASITVNEVSGNTAMFSRIQKDENTFEIETPEITVEGDNFYGTDIIIMKQFENGQCINIDIVKYKVIGKKISGPTLKDIFAK